MSQSPAAPAPKAPAAAGPAPKATAPAGPARKAPAAAGPAPKATAPAGPAPKATATAAPSSKAPSPAAPSPEAPSPVAPAARPSYSSVLRLVSNNSDEDFDREVYRLAHLRPLVSKAASQRSQEVDARYYRVSKRTLKAGGLVGLEGGKLGTAYYRA
ncbi:predicted GPI-anchored protein 58 isoform X2 [Oryza sativa Japonica Group]|uniref:predicted GPI-anchored protein 58 isoform X2 n=1 Tax=Oryza sativa subsp. japonica TaxID=39947 RepID=UPI00339C95C8